MSAPHPPPGPQPCPEAGGTEIPGTEISSPAIRSTEIHLDARLVLGEHDSADVPVRLGYSGDDPFSVALEFLGDAAGAGVWRFSRDLLWDGLHRPSGLGDVRVWPPCPCQGRTSLRVMLRGRERTVLIDLPVREVRRWLRRESFALIRPGTEGDAIDWDGALRELAAD
ncbi:SsgA family sporulation/cell division regulator [Streptomyces sp. NPDC048717]|uniref:SsgA family sporulation/cell division regulator n=1 Tax=Streptomyces sp. NPDC048717 TaxID=3154928 RepID=UPI00342E40BD